MLIENIEMWNAFFPLLEKYFRGTFLKLGFFEFKLVSVAGALQPLTKQWDPSKETLPSKWKPDVDWKISYKIQSKAIVSWLHGLIIKNIYHFFHLSRLFQTFHSFLCK